MYYISDVAIASRGNQRNTDGTLSSAELLDHFTHFHVP